MKKLLFLPILVLSIIGIGFYTLETTDVNTGRNVLDVVHPQCIVDNGLLTRTYYMQYQILPTEKTQADTAYRIVIDNGLVRREDKVYWSELELGIQQAKTIKHSISENEFTALGMHPLYDTTVTAVKRTKDATYMTLPVMYVVLLVLALTVGLDLKKKRRPARIRTLTAPIQLSDEELAKRCLQCKHLKTSHGILRCELDKCEYGY